MRDIEERRERRAGRHRPPWWSFIIGLIFTAAFGIYWFLHPLDWWPVFPIIFAGVLPMLNALRQALSTPSRKKLEKENAKQLETELERQILQAAHDQKGRLTVAGAALRANLPIQEASRILERLAKDGHAVMNVTSSGTIEYEFPDFLPDAERRQLT
jgi:predicted transcriptional regulator